MGFNKTLDKKKYYFSHFLFYIVLKDSKSLFKSGCQGKLDFSLGNCIFIWKSLNLIQLHIHEYKYL